MERDKKIIKLAVFGIQVAALLIDFYPHPPAALRINKTCEKKLAYSALRGDNYKSRYHRGI